MCIAILNTEQTLDKHVFENCWHNNPDGAGIAFIKNGKVCIAKEMDDVDRFYRTYAAIRRWNTLPVILHFRVATSGRINLENCHPFEVTDGLVMAHNGILNHVNPTRKRSDTLIFIREILRKLPKSFLHNVAIERLLGAFIGDSKLVFLDRQGRYHIINEQHGHWDQGQLNWFSNYSYTDNERFGLRSMGYAGNESLGLCEGCGNYVEADSLSYSHYLNAELCGDCWGWYSIDLQMETGNTV